MPDDRRRARELAHRFVAAGEPVGWFEPLYAEARAGDAIIPWDDRLANPYLVAWLDAYPELVRGRALDVGCGLGDNAEELARRGCSVDAFDVSLSAVTMARDRYPASPVAYGVADLRAPPPSWNHAFDLIVEIYTLQTLPPEPRAEAAGALRRLLAPGGTLLVIARGRDPGDDPGQMPWPLTRAEVEAIGAGELTLASFDDFADGEVPPVRRFRAAFRRA